jgi:hypothetical protein
LSLQTYFPSDEAIQSVQDLFFEAMQRYKIRRYKIFTDEATRSP